jgi:hypothetical protein
MDLDRVHGAPIHLFTNVSECQLFYTSSLGFLPPFIAVFSIYFTLSFRALAPFQPWVASGTPLPTSEAKR